MKESIPHCPTAADLKPVLEEAKAFHKQKPWRHIPSDDLFAIEDPVTGERLYCSILGNLHEMYALNVYPGETGLASFAAFLSMQEISLLAGHHYLAQQDLIQLEYTDRESLSSQEWKSIKETGVSFRGRKAWPQMIRFRPGYAPSALNAEDLRILRFALEQVGDITRQVADGTLDVTPVIDEDEITLFVRTPEKTKDGKLKWRDEWDTLPLLLPGNEYPDEALPYDELRLGRIKRAGYSRHNAPWEVHTGYLMLPMEPEPGTEEGELPYLPHVQAIMEGQNGAALHMFITSPQEARETLLDAFLNAMEETEVMPEAVLVLTAEAEAAVKGICQALEIPVIPSESLPLTEKVFQGFIEEYVTS
ncbi:MAG: hypothetical protein R6W89_00680 [Candidatus Hydrogenedentota bacterium]